MIQDKRYALLPGLALAATLVAGCIIETDRQAYPSPVGTGALTVLWTVDGTTELTVDVDFPLGSFIPL
jgi:hypothetical protein